MSFIEKLIDNIHLLVAGAIGLALLYFMVPGARTLVDEATPKATLQPVVLDAKKTALLVFEFNVSDCAGEDRTLCVTSLDSLHHLVMDAETRGARIVRYTGDSTKEELPDLKSDGIDTVMIVGTQANGSAAIHAVSAVQRGYRVALAADTMPLMQSNKTASAAFVIAMTLGLAKSAIFSRTDMITFD